MHYRPRATGTYPPPRRIALAVRDLIDTIREHPAARRPVRRGSTLVAAVALGLEIDDGC